MLSIKTPLEYVSQPDVIEKAGKYIKKYGNKALIIGSKTPLKAVGEAFYKSLEENNIEYIIKEFTGFPTLAAIEDYSRQAEEEKVNLIIGIGGGKVNDTAKAVGNKTKLPVIAIPTIAATCAAWAAVSILYNEEGDFVTSSLNENSPRLILADTRIIITAPARYTYAGIVDTLAKWYETVPNLDIAEDNITLNIAVNGAKLAFDLLVRHGRKVVEDGQKNIITKESVAVVDAIIYLAGFVGSFTEDEFYGGFAHPFYHASTRLSGTRFRLHGEKVALGLLIQLVLEKKQEDYIIETIREFDRFHLALTLEDIGVRENAKEDLSIVAERVLKEFPGYTKLGIGKTAEEIVDAAFRADALVRRVLSNPVEVF
ncbi:iron-containing alcohol dehydrogenase family protein [Anaerocolumna xylanovorans]|uniref:Glycerol dehydrogenase n=1 Tax=Anaerocolumna xylanovorans DSM 12503 TaxID=1121345 RepID=A0A1M7XWW3_9FIRM|nr:iron-containing alcohol dehydrogenase family protein [Anaerocolumna xylanovorans]SHO43305.1 glycerol dehydrogenase [Anaerocolumna xylanovorans DSM 12503]